MTKKDLFRIIIKLFGLYVAINVLVMLPETIMVSIYGYDSDFATVSIITLLVLLGFLYVLLVKTDSVINLFKLDKGYDSDKVDVNKFSSNSIIKLGLIIISVYFIIVSIPDLVTNLFYMFKSSIPQNELDGVLDLMMPTSPNYYVLTSASIKLLLGVILILNSNRITSRIEKLN